MACWVCAQDQVNSGKNAKTCDVTHREPQTQNEMFFLNLK